MGVKWVSAPQLNWPSRGLCKALTTRPPTTSPCSATLVRSSYLSMTDGSWVVGSKQFDFEGHLWVSGTCSTTSTHIEHDWQPWHAHAGELRAPDVDASMCPRTRAARWCMSSVLLGMSSAFIWCVSLKNISTLPRINVLFMFASAHSLANLHWYSLGYGWNSPFPSKLCFRFTTASSKCFGSSCPTTG